MLFFLYFLISICGQDFFICFLLRKVDIFCYSYCNSLYQLFIGSDIFFYYFSVDEEIILFDDDEVICLDVNSLEKKKIKLEVEIKLEVILL